MGEVRIWSKKGLVAPVCLALRHFGFCMLLLLGVLPPLRAADVRLALMNFTTEENSYPAMQAAVDISFLLQPLVPTSPGNSWVERNELCFAQKELDLSLLQPSRANALRCGKWAKADRLVLGNFARDERGDWTLELEVMDVAQAETLAKTKLCFPNTGGMPLALLRTNLTAIVTELGKLNIAADKVAAANASMQTIAPLFFFDVSRWPGLGVNLQDTLFESIELLATNRNMRVATFARANRASPEAELAVLGLTDSDNTAWQKAADIFLWGSYSVKPLLGGAKNLDVSLWIWHNGRISQFTESSIFNGKFPLIAARELGSRLAKHAMELPIVGTPEEHPNKRIADAAVAATGGIRPLSPRSPPGPMGSPIPAGIQMFDLACFFDPGNAGAQAERIRHRYGMPPFSGGMLGGEFSIKLRRSQEWGRYVERFGLHPPGEANTALRYTTIVAQYVESLNGINRSMGGMQVPGLNGAPGFDGFPSDVPSEIEAQWKSEFEREYGRRIVNSAKYLAGGPVFNGPTFGEGLPPMRTLLLVQRELTNLAIIPISSDERSALGAAIDSRVAEIRGPRRLQQNGGIPKVGPPMIQ